MIPGGAGARPGSLALVSANARVAPAAGWDAWTEEQRRNARLLFDAELTAGTLAEGALSRPEVYSAVRTRVVPPRPVRLGEQVLYKFGRRRFEQAVAPLRAARLAVCGAAGNAPSPPRILVRVDEFPHYQAWDRPDRFGEEQFERFHRIMSGAGVPYLVAVLPRVSREPLNPAGSGSRPLQEPEVAMLRRLAREGVSFGLHGRDHRTRFDSPRRHSELCGLDRAQTEALLEQASAELASYGIAPQVFVPPYNRFDARQLPWLARRFAVVCGGPESIGRLGFHHSPQWRGETVYLPSYAPLYGHAAEVADALPQALEYGGGLWLAVVLHWGWEHDAGWRDLEELVREIAPYAARWEDFLAAVERSRGPAGVARREGDSEGVGEGHGGSGG